MVRENEVSQEQFDKELYELSQKNPKVKQFLKSYDGYGGLPQNIKNLIDKEFGIERITIMIRK